LAVEFHAGVDRRLLLGLLETCGYHPRGIPVAPLPAEVEPSYANDHTYVFSVVEPG
jgi:hypothetical protein